MDSILLNGGKRDLPPFKSDILLKFLKNLEIRITSGTQHTKRIIVSKLHTDQLNLSSWRYLRVWAPRGSSLEYACKVEKIYLIVNYKYYISDEAVKSHKNGAYSFSICVQLLMNSGIFPEKLLSLILLDSIRKQSLAEEMEYKNKARTNWHYFTNR